MAIRRTRGHPVGRQPWLTAAGLSILVVLTSGCQPPAEGQFHIANRTTERVEVRWISGENSFATIEPGMGRSFGFGEDACTSFDPDNAMVATLAGGKTRTYGPPICNGTMWTIIP